MLGSWPRLSTLSPIWFSVALAAELASFTCNLGLQRLALRTKGWFAVVTAGLAGNAVTDTLPGGDAAGAAVQFGMLATAGFDTDTAADGLTAFSLLGIGGLLALPVLALPAMLAGEAGAVLQLGRRVTELGHRPDHVTVTFSDGETGRYDLVVGADGVRSQARSTVFPARRCRETPGRSRGGPVSRRTPPMLAVFNASDRKAGLITVTDADSYLYLFLLVNVPRPGRPDQQESRSCCVRLWPSSAVPSPTSGKTSPIRPWSITRC